MFGFGFALGLGFGLWLSFCLWFRLPFGLFLFNVLTTVCLGVADLPRGTGFQGFLFRRRCLFNFLTPVCLGVADLPRGTGFQFRIHLYYMDQIYLARLLLITAVIAVSNPKILLHHPRTLSSLLLYLCNNTPEDLLRLLHYLDLDLCLDPYLST